MVRHNEEVAKLEFWSLGFQVAAIALLATSVGMELHGRF
jgi:hypothetical protein